MSNTIRLQDIILKFTLFVFVLLMFSCTTKRKKNDISKLGKLFHNTTAKYNGYFNANELVTESIEELKLLNEDDYRKVLPVYDYVNIENAGPVSSSLDEAIKKVTTVTALHEPSQWVDDCYVLMGKAQYLKQDYDSSIETLEYFEEQFDPKNPYGRAYGKKKGSTRKTKKEKKQEKKARDKARKEKDKARKEDRKDKEKTRDQERKDRLKAREKAKKEGKSRKVEVTDIPKETQPIKIAQTNSDTKDKKEDKKEEKPPKGMFKHKPAYYEGLFWLSRAFTETDRHTIAEQILKKIDKAPDAPKEIKREIPAAFANLYIKKKDYTLALASLSNALEFAKTKDEKARYLFIMAQIHELNGNIKNAFDGYDKVIKLSNNYDMAFNAKLNKIKASRKSGKITRSVAVSQLNSMLKDSKNEGYEGKIYFTKAEVALEEGEIEEAVANFKNALSFSGNSQNVQTEAYYKLATLLYDQENFVNSKLYYDSTLAVMSPTDDRILEVRTFSTNLSDIVRNIEVVEKQDSLLKLSTMSKEEQRKIAQELLASGVNPDNDTNAARNTNPNIIASSQRFGTSGRSSFFAYNAISKNQGLKEFKRVWGPRALEDDWRRSTRSDATDEDIDVDAGAVTEETKAISDAEFNRVMKEVPTNPAAKEQAHKKIQDALMQLGVLYRDRLQNYKKSISALEQLVERYPKYHKMDQALYYLYLSYNDLGKKKLANKTANKLSKDFPESKFNKLASDPSYAKELLNDENKLENYYNKTQSLFEAHEYAKVMERVTEAKKTFGLENALSPKFELLNAMSSANKGGEEKYIANLERLIKKYPNTPEEVRANEILRFLKGDQEAFDQALYNEGEGAFEKDELGLHYAMVVVYELSKRETDKVKVAISSFNKNYHKLLGLKSSDIILNKDNKSKVVLIRGFENEERAMAYYESVQKNKKDFVKDFNHDFFIATQKNFREVIKQKKISNYRVFFDKNYK